MYSKSYFDILNEVDLKFILKRNTMQLASLQESFAWHC